MKLGNRHRNFFIAVGIGIVAAVAAVPVAPDLFPAFGASAFSLAYLVLTALDMPRLTADFLRAHAGDEDAPPLVVFLLTLAVVIYVTAALFVALADQSLNALRLSAGVVSVVLSWLMIHVMWGMHYAWEFYQSSEGQDKKEEQRGGLEFPGTDEPGGSDFVYFSLVVAMTAQTSDVDVKSSAMRRVVTGQSLFSYLFNTVMIAAAVNIVVQAGQ